MAPNKCSVTMAGNNFMVTVKAPKAPWTHTQISDTVASKRAVRCRQAMIVRIKIRAPTPDAKYRWIISTHALPVVTGPVGIAVCAASICTAAPNGVAAP